MMVFYEEAGQYFPKQVMTTGGQPRRARQRRPDSGLVSGGRGWVESASDGDLFPTNVLEEYRVEKYWGEGEGRNSTQKPVAMLEKLIKTYTRESGVVLDFTCGTGSCLAACINTNRRYIGIELKPEFCRTIHTRLSSAPVGGKLM